MDVFLVGTVSHVEVVVDAATVAEPPKRPGIGRDGAAQLFFNARDLLIGDRWPSPEDHPLLEKDDIGLPKYPVDHCETPKPPTTSVPTDFELTL